MQDHLEYNRSTAPEDAMKHGYQPLPIRNKSKKPHLSAWTHFTTTTEEVTEKFDQFAEENASGVGLLLGEPSNGLIDIDLDHPKASRLKEHFLPDTPMKTGRVGRPHSHYWYVVDNPEKLPATRRYKMPDGRVSVELRSTGSQTVIPPSIHPSGETYRWEKKPFGGDAGPLVVDGVKLSLQVALLGMGCVLLDNWPKQGGRHDAYLALAGGLLRYGHEGVHPYWETNIIPLIRALAISSEDEDGPDSREHESIKTTITRLRNGDPVSGFPTLAEIIGDDHADLVRRMAAEVESLAGHENAPAKIEEIPDQPTLPLVPEDEDVDKNPLEKRQGSWEPVDLDPYLAGEIVVKGPSLLRRSDGAALIYPGRVNLLYGRSESAKSWVALYACIQEMEKGERVMYLDFEDEPSATIDRLKRLQVPPDDTRHQFSYIRPEDPLAAMQHDSWGNHKPNSIGNKNMELFDAALREKDPSLIIADGMTVLYGLHGLNSNDATGTDIITNWLKKLTRNGRSTVIVIDHIGKGGGKDAVPIGSQHKVAMVQGTALHVHVITQPAPGVLGHLQLVVGKDRPGEVRHVSTPEKPSVAAEVFMDSRKEKETVITIEPPDTSPKFQPSDTQQAELSRVVTLEPFIVETFLGDLDLQMKVGDIENELRGKDRCPEFSRATINRALQGLVSQGVIESSGKNRWTSYALVNLQD